MVKIILGKEYSSFQVLAKRYNNLSINDLIERAAQGIYTNIKRKYRQNKKNIVIFAGPGKTGSIALALASLLSQDDYKTSTYLFYHKKHITQESESYRNQMIEKGCSLYDVYDKFTVPKLNEQKDLIIDALFGVGLSAPIQSGGFAKLIDIINNSKCDVVSIDIPSGLMSENNINPERNKIIKAKNTISIENPKLSFFFSENNKYIGEISLVNLGVGDDVQKNLRTNMFVSTQTSIYNILKEEKTKNNNYKSTTLMLIGGNNFNIGNILISSKSAIYSGAKEIVCQVPYSAITALQVYNPQVNIISNKETELYISEIKEYENKTIVFADNMGLNHRTISSISECLKKTKRPIVISGEMANIFLGRYDMLNDIPKESVLIVSKENLSQLKISNENEFDLIDQIKILAEKYNICVLAKLSYNCVITPSGDTFFNDIKNRDVISTKSSTSVIAAVVGSLISQGFSSLSSVIIASYIVPMSADIACGNKKSINISIEDLVDKINESMAILMS